jgi:hypothetical protein
MLHGVRDRLRDNAISSHLYRRRQPRLGAWVELDGDGRPPGERLEGGRTRESVKQGSNTGRLLTRSESRSVPLSRCTSSPARSPSAASNSASRARTASTCSPDSTSGSAVYPSRSSRSLVSASSVAALTPSSRQCRRQVHGVSCVHLPRIARATQTVPPSLGRAAILTRTQAPLRHAGPVNARDHPAASPPFERGGQTHEISRHSGPAMLADDKNHRSAWRHEHAGQQPVSAPGWEFCVRLRSGLFLFHAVAGQPLTC